MLVRSQQAAVSPALRVSPAEVLNLAPRVQVLGGVDYILVKMMSPSVFKLYSTIIRTANNILGGVSFVTTARILGSQRSGTPPPPKAPAAATSTKKGRGKK